MYDEYLKLFQEYSAIYGKKVAIFIMVGMFYEIYDIYDPSTGKGNTTASEIIETLGLKVSIKKGEGLNGYDGIVAGIPDHSIHRWAGRLTSNGWTVILAEQVKSSSGKVIRRDVQRILTPGSHIEAAGLNDHFITFVTLFDDIIALVALDLTTGHLHTFETSLLHSSDILQFMEVYPPKEVLWSYHGTKQTCPYSEKDLILALGCPSTISFHQRPALNSGAWLVPSFREEFLILHCNLKCLLPTHIALFIKPGSASETAILSLLEAIKEFWSSLKLGSLLVYPWIPGSMMRLGENALVQLHMITDSEKTSVFSLFNTPATAMGRRGIRERLLKPSASFSEIQANLNAVETWTHTVSDERTEVLKRMKTISDLHRVFRNLQQGTLSPSELLGIDTSLKSLKWLGASEIDLSYIQKEIFSIFDLSKTYSASEDVSLFVSGLVPEIDSLEEKIQTYYTSIQSWIQERLRPVSMAQDSLKPEFREKSLYIKGPKSVIQNLKLSNTLPKNVTVVINKTGSHLESPEVDAFFYGICKTREELKREKIKASMELGYEVSMKILEPWMRICDWITYKDVNLTLALTALRLGYVKPTLVNESESSFSIEGIRHPILESQDSRIQYVRHSVSIGSLHSGWLLYGLNASGKSSLMRATGIAVLLAQGGSFVPASKMELSPFSSLHTRIMNTDNIWMGLSSFAVEMSEMRDIFRDAGPRSFVLGDEMCSGTETISATALVAAGLQGLLRRKARFFFATHLHGLMQFQEICKNPSLRIWHLHVEYDPIKEKLIYHRLLREGSGSSCYGLEVAKAMKLPSDILEDAFRFRKQLTGEVNLLETTGSSWNSSVIRQLCDICKSPINLEVHHIQERSTAKNGFLSDGSHIHASSNLTVLCEACHDDVHRNKITIGPYIQTSEGSERSIVTDMSSKKTSKWSQDDLETIQNVFTRFPKMPLTTLSKYLLSNYNITISSSSLKKMQS